MADPKRYASTASLTDAASGTTQAAARMRRDAAFAGFEQLKEAALAGDFAAVEQFQRDAVRLVQAKVPGWQHLWTETIAAETARTEQWLADLAGGGFRHFKEAAISRTVPVSSEATFGMCGLLQKWDSGPQA